MLGSQTPAKPLVFVVLGFSVPQNAIGRPFAWYQKAGDPSSRRIIDFDRVKTGTTVELRLKKQLKVYSGDRFWTAPGVTMSGVFPWADQADNRAELTTRRVTLTNNAPHEAPAGVQLSAQILKKINNLTSAANIGKSGGAEIPAMLLPLSRGVNRPEKVYVCFAVGAKQASLRYAYLPVIGKIDFDPIRLSGFGSIAIDLKAVQKKSAEQGIPWPDEGPWSFEISNTSAKPVSRVIKLARVSLALPSVAAAYRETQWDQRRVLLSNLVVDYGDAGLVTELIADLAREVKRTKVKTFAELEKRDPDACMAVQKALNMAAWLPEYFDALLRLVDS